MPTIDLPHATVNYREAGPESSDLPPVVFVHGALVDGSLWDQVAARLAQDGVRSFAPDWPLGSHRIPVAAGADQSPRGVARLILSFLEALDLDDVTLVGNDSGGAITQFVLDTDATRVGRVVLTNCDAFTNFPPEPFRTLFRPMRWAPVVHALGQTMRSTRLRHSPAGFGLLARRFDAAQTWSWIEPGLTTPGVRRDFARLVASIDRSELDGVSSRMGAFGGPALLLWGDADRLFSLKWARRLQDTFADAELVLVPGAKTFVMLDAPDRVAEAIAAFVRRTAATTA